MKDTKLTLECRHTNGDWVDVTRYHNPNSREQEFNIQVRWVRDGTARDVALNREDMRKLFNWLGVQLHKQGDQVR